MPTEKEYCRLEIWSGGGGIFSKTGYLVEIKYEDGPSIRFYATGGSNDTFDLQEERRGKYRRAARAALAQSGWTPSEDRGSRELFERPIQQGRSIDEPKLSINGMEPTTRKTV